MLLFVVLAILHFFAAMALAFGMDQIALIPWRRAKDAHWTERARRLFPALKINTTLFLLAPATLAAVQAFSFPALSLGYLYAAIAGIPGAILGSWPMAHALYPQSPFSRWLRAVIANFTLQWLLLGVFFAAAVCMPKEFNATVLEIAVGFVVFKAWLICGGMLLLWRMTKSVIPASERLLAIVQRCSERSGIPLPKTWIIRGAGANALALPIIRTVAVTEGAMEILSDEEIEAVCAHEFAHLTESKGVIRIRILRAYLNFPLIFFKPVLSTWGPIGLIGISLAIVLVNTLTLRLSRKMENRADAMAKAHGGASDDVYARALERMYQRNHIPAVLRGKLSHPNLYDRMVAVGVTPDYPRPLPPPKYVWCQALQLLLLIAIGFGAGFRLFGELRAQDAESRRRNQSSAPASVSIGWQP